MIIAALLTAGCRSFHREECYMFHFIAVNAGTIVVTLILIAIVALIIRSRFRERKNGQCPCGCHCEGCSGACHKLLG